MPEQEITTSPSADAQAANVDPPAQAATTTPNAQAATDTEPVTFEEARRLRSEATNLRKRLKSYEDAEEAAKAAALSEVEKANKKSLELETLNQQYKQQLVMSQVKLAASAKGIIDPDLAALAIQNKLELGEDGLPTNVEKALDDLIKSKPYLAPKSAETKEDPATPAQTAQPANQRPPLTPAMIPGRQNIQSPGQPQGKIPSWNDVYKRQ